MPAVRYDRTARRSAEGSACHSWIGEIDGLIWIGKGWIGRKHRWIDGWIEDNIDR